MYPKGNTTGFYSLDDYSAGPTRIHLVGEVFFHPGSERLPEGVLRLRPASQLQLVGEREIRSRLRRPAARTRAASAASLDRDLNQSPQRPVPPGGSSAATSSARRDRRAATISLLRGVRQLWASRRPSLAVSGGCQRNNTAPAASNKPPHTERIPHRQSYAPGRNRISARGGTDGVQGDGVFVAGSSPR